MTPRADKSPRALLSLALPFALALLTARGAAGQIPPDEHWRTLETEHFRVTFPERLDSLGRVAAARAERAFERISSVFVAPPAGRTELLLTDHSDFPSGAASVSPYRVINVSAAPPVDGFAHSYFADWLEVVITHELVHVFHLDTPDGLASALRAVMGRVPKTWPFFPQLALPLWTVEGIATWYESALTGAGRVEGTQHDMVLRTALLEGRFEDIGQASGRSREWPSAERPYVYGSLFMEYLTQKYGRDRLGAFVQAVGGQWIPYRVNAAARDAFGVSFSAAWEDWEAAYREDVEALTARLAARAPLTRPELITRGARLGLYPRVSPDGSTLLYARSDGRSDAQLRAAAPDGTGPGRLVRTNGPATFAWLPDGGVVFAQLDLVDSYRTAGDLYVRAPAGEVRRVTRGARLDHPSAAPDGRSAVAVRQGGGTTTLVEVDLSSGEVRALTGGAAAHWAFPGVSPDGRWIAASRWRSGAFFDVVILDREGRVAAEVTRDRAVDTAPAWSPDGRWLVWGSDRSGIPNLLGAEVDPATGAVGAARQVTNVLTGAAFPSVDPSGRWIYFSGYHADGWEVERVPFDPASWTEAFPLDPRFEAERPPESVLPASGEARRYSAWPTLLPRFWEPVVRGPVTASGREVIGSALGVSSAGRDLVDRHAVSLMAVFALSGGELDAALRYSFAGFGIPLLSVGADQFWDAAGPFQRPREGGAPDTLWTVERERSLSASLTFPARRYRWAAVAALGGGLAWERRELLDNRLEPALLQLGDPTSRLGDVRASVALTTARGHAFSLGSEEGASLSLQGRARWHLGLSDSVAGTPGRDRSFEETVLRTRLFGSFRGPGYADHVLALFGSVGAARGPGADAYHFDAGGTAGREPVTGLSLAGWPALLFPVRGYGNGRRSGRYAWSLSGEYRFPLALVNAGAGLIPLHLDGLSGALFFDAGNAWGAWGEDRPRPQTLASAGAELLADVLVFFDTPMSLRGGVAVPLRGSEAAELYLRVGRSF